MNIFHEKHSRVRRVRPEGGEGTIRSRVVEERSRSTEGEDPETMEDEIRPAMNRATEKDDRRGGGEADGAGEKNTIEHFDVT